MLDATYGALKRVNRRNLVIGGNTWTGGEVTPLNFIRAMRLPSGRRPRMDLYGHNPFTARAPRLSEDPLRYGFADFSDLDTLAGWLDRYGYRDRRGRRLRLFLSEFVIQTDHGSYEFNYYVDRRTQAGWLARALRITRRWRRIYTLGYLGLYDEQPRPDGLEVNRGSDRLAGPKEACVLHLSPRLGYPAHIAVSRMGEASGLCRSTHGGQEERMPKRRLIATGVVGAAVALMCSGPAGATPPKPPPKPDDTTTTTRSAPAPRTPSWAPPGRTTSGARGAATSSSRWRATTRRRARRVTTAC